MYFRYCSSSVFGELRKVRQQTVQRNRFQNLHCNVMYMVLFIVQVGVLMVEK